MTSTRSPGTQLPEPLLAWLTTAVERGASDLHIVASYPPALRLHGEIVQIGSTPLDPSATDALLAGLCPPELFSRLQAAKSVDFSLSVEIAGKVRRFRVNLFHSGGDLGGCLRVVPDTIPDFTWAGLPEELAWKVADLPDGLVIVTGATGSGKTTTLAMLIQLMNQQGGYRIITVEEPIEYAFPRAANTILTQREVGADILNFADGLKHGLRQDPDVILVGEIRDRETAQMVLSASETGHLVLTTLHTRDAKGAITRFMDFFPQDFQRDIRSQLALSLRVVIAQRLLPSSEPGRRRLLALELLWNTHPIASSIRSGKFESIDNYLVTNRDDGMLSFDESLRQLLRAGKITRETAEQHVRDVSFLGR